MPSWYHVPARAPDADVGTPVGERIFLYPLPGVEWDAPASSYGRKGHVALAFVAALHHLTANQRAVLILRDVLSFTSYQGFSSYWPGVADHPEQPGTNHAYSEANRELSRIHNRLEKVVVTDSYSPATDNPLVRDDDGHHAQRRRSVDQRAACGAPGDILVHGSRTLWNSLLADGLVDELHLLVGAVVLGGGTPIFDAPSKGLTLLEARRSDGSDNVLLRYGTV